MNDYLKVKTLLLMGLLVCSFSLLAQSNVSVDKLGFARKTVPNQPLFQINNPDYKLSPYTGMTREHWKEAGLYLLKGAFSYINRLDDPMVFPQQPGKSYPINADQLPVEKLEGLCRTLFIAAPLLKENPDLVINNIKVADYYRHQIRLLLNPSSPTFIRSRKKEEGTNQILVEFGALSISLFAVPEVLWEPLNQKEKDALASTMLSWGDGPSTTNNWKFFNMFVLSFFREKGYSVNEDLLVEYAKKNLEHYQGNGWYDDTPAYDYYSMWAFQMYGPLWAEFFGKKHYPELAQQFLDNFKGVKDNYPYMFSRNGEMIMWGRSISYRMGSIIPFPLMGMVNEPGTNYGWMRRIASGVIKQFVTNPDFMQDNIPTLGFYGAFEPAVQYYSCRGSVFWMGKAFLGLLIPEDSPFWTAKENEGAWEKELQKGKVYNKFQTGSNVLITDYPNIGASEVRAWCNIKEGPGTTNFRNGENYNRLSYNSEFLWQADKDGVVAMNYIFKNKDQQWEPLRLYTFKKYEDGVYYRAAVLESNANIQMGLADITLPNGILRIDQNKSTDSVELRLGHYALPQLKGQIKKTSRKINGHEIQIIDNGIYQLALVSLKGWKGMETIDTKDVHPQSKYSTVINVKDEFVPQSDKNVIYATLMLWKKSGEKWADDELVPVKSIEQSVDKVAVKFKDGTKKLVDMK